MSLQAGSSIGSYELVGPLGVGGMGERDTRLNREVALKLLPPTYPQIRIGSPASLAKRKRSTPRPA
jgi:hypothetical protein